MTTSYAYDYESRLTSITRTGVTTNSFAYNGLDTRVSKTDSAGTTSYKRAGATVTDSLLKSTVPSTTTDYTPGVSSRVSGTSTFDNAGIKNTDEQTDGSGDISASRQYDAFGNVVSSNQAWTGPFGYGGPYGYQTDGDHGLMLLGHRYYEPDTGRFLTRDPIKDGRNWYGYCGGSPLSRADPFGLQYIYLRNKLEGVGHAWVYIIYPGGRVYTIDNSKFGNRRGVVIDRPGLREQWFDGQVIGTFDPVLWPTPAGMLFGVDRRYMLRENNCVHTATGVFKRVAGIDLTYCENLIGISDPDQLMLLMKKSDSYVPGSGPPRGGAPVPRPAPIPPVGARNGAQGSLIWD